MTEHIDRHGRSIPQRPAGAPFSPAPPPIVDPVVMQRAADRQEREYTQKLRRAALDFMRWADGGLDSMDARQRGYYVETREVLRKLAEDGNLGPPSS